MKETLIALMMGLALMVPAYAEECVTPEFAEEYIKANNPDVTVEERIIVDGDGHILYSSPYRNDKLLHVFMDGCRIYAGSPTVSDKPGEGA